MSLLSLSLGPSDTNPRNNEIMRSYSSYLGYQYESLDDLAPRYRGNTACWGSAPLRLARLCCLGILLPILCTVIPVYARYVLYADTRLVLSASDMRLLNSHMSTAWCQKQKLRTTSSFDAYLVEKQPTLAPKGQMISMVRSFEIDDDLKEYWGFYLLRGSEIKVSSCARYFGANVMMIKGRGGLRYCAYVGEESNEGIDSIEQDIEVKKLETQWKVRTDNAKKIKVPPPPMFKQDSKTEQARILELLKARKQKRKLIRLLENQAYLRNYNETSTNDENTSVLQKVDNALRKMLEKEIRALYQEIKSILYSSKTSNAKNHVAARLEDQTPRNKSQSVKLPVIGDNQNVKEFLSTDIGDEENGGYEVDDDLPDFNATADGFAEDRGTIDHRHMNDTSESHEESSASSSEEAMLHCRGVLISHPLIPESGCTNETDPHQNTIHYVIEEDGYYYFIFSSANEMIPNELTVKFELQKTVYNTSGATSSCHNATTCEFPLSFASNELVILSIPIPDSDHSEIWDETFIVQSTCEPRLPLYLSFCLALPLLILLCASR